MEGKDTGRPAFKSNLVLSEGRLKSTVSGVGNKQQQQRLYLGESRFIKLRIK